MRRETKELERLPKIKEKLMERKEKEKSLRKK